MTRVRRIHGRDASHDVHRDRFQIGAKKEIGDRLAVDGQSHRLPDDLVGEKRMRRLQAGTLAIDLDFGIREIEGDVFDGSVADRSNYPFASRFQFTQ